jgi:hypothetical protein
MQTNDVATSDGFLHRGTSPYSLSQEDGLSMSLEPKLGALTWKWMKILTSMNDIH